MEQTSLHRILALILGVLTCLGVAHAALAAPGDLLFEIGSPHLFDNVMTIAVDRSGNLFGINWTTKKIQKVDSTGKFLTQWGGPGSGNGQFLNPNGLAVDSSGSVYVADTGNNRIQKFDASGKYLLQWGSTGNGNGQFVDPYAVTADGNGTIYVAEGGASGGSRIQKFDASGKYLAQWSCGSGPIQSVMPTALAVDCSGNVYVTDLATGRILKFSSDGTLLLQWGGDGTANGQFSSLRGIAADCNGNVYASDSDGYRVEKFDSTGRYLWQLGGNEGRDGKFTFPSGLALDASGNLYVSDNYNARVQKFSPAGNYLAEFGNNGDGQFNNPAGIAVDGSGDFFVADGFYSSVKKFAADGSFLTRWESPGGRSQAVAADPCGNVFVLGSDDLVYKFTGTGQLQTQWGVPTSASGAPILPFFSPVAVAVDSACDNVYVVDYHNSQVLKFNSSGAFIQLYPRYDLQWPYGIAADAAGFAYVANTYLDNIVKFDSSGNLVTSWGGTGTGAGQFQHPYGVAVDAVGNVYVADSNNSRIQVFSSTGTFQGQWADAGSYLAVNQAGTMVYVVGGKGVQAFSGFGASFTLEYQASPNGSISGAAKQTVAPGGSGSQVTAVANPGYQFVSWSDGVTTAARNDQAVNANLSVTASFSLVPTTCTLTFTAGAGGIIRGTSPQVVLLGGSSSCVTAVPSTGYHFVNWTGDGGFVTTTVNPLVLQNVRAAQNITANFAANAPPSSYTLTFKAGTGGTLSGTSRQILRPGGWSSPVKAVARNGYKFVNWTGDGGFKATTDNPLIIKATATQNITANFTVDQYTVTFVAGPRGEIRGDQHQTVDFQGSTRAVTALPDRGCRFVNWTDANKKVVSTSATLKLTDVSCDRRITANFERLW